MFMDDDAGHVEASSSQRNAVIGTNYPNFVMDQIDPHEGAGVDSFLPSFQAMAAGSQILPWQDRPFFPSPLPPLPPPVAAAAQAVYGDLYPRRLTFAYDGGFGSPFGIPTDPIGLSGLYTAGGGGGAEALLRGGGGLTSSISPFSEMGKMTAQEIMDAKALAASKSHSEAERRRRERINAHLVKLRSLLPSTTKTDKASLLAEVIQHVKELKRQTSEIAEESQLPTESDELTVDATSDEEGRLLVTASLCCEDRSDLLPELIKALKALRLRTIKAEITTLGGRLKNVLVITADDCLDAASDNSPKQQLLQPQYCVASIQDALKAVMERTVAADEPASAGAIKRQRIANLSSVLERRSI